MDEDEKTSESDFMSAALDELNEEFYRLSGRLYENIELLPEPLYNYISARLTDRYKEAYELLDQTYTVSIRRQRFRQRLRGAYAPWKFLWFKNRAAKEDIADFRLEFGQWLEEREERRREAAEGTESDDGEDEPDSSITP